MEMPSDPNKVNEGNKEWNQRGVQKKKKKGDLCFEILEDFAGRPDGRRKIKYYIAEENLDGVGLLETIEENSLKES
jgi:hypothetical protein